MIVNKIKYFQSFIRLFLVASNIESILSSGLTFNIRSFNLEILPSAEYPHCAVVYLANGFINPFNSNKQPLNKNCAINKTGIEISYIQRDLITVIFYYQISLKPLKTLSLSQVSFPLLFPLYYIVP